MYNTYTHTHTYYYIILYTRRFGAALSPSSARRWIKIIFCVSVRPRIRTHTSASLVLSHSSATPWLAWSATNGRLLFAASGREGFFLVIRFTIFFFRSYIVQVQHVARTSYRYYYIHYIILLSFRFQMCTGYNMIHNKLLQFLGPSVRLPPSAAAELQMSTRRIMRGTLYVY